MSSVCSLSPHSFPPALPDPMTYFLLPPLLFSASLKTPPSPSPSYLSVSKSSPPPALQAKSNPPTPPHPASSSLLRATTLGSWYQPQPLVPLNPKYTSPCLCACLTQPQSCTVPKPWAQHACSPPTHNPTLIQSSSGSSLHARMHAARTHDSCAAEL